MTEPSPSIFGGRDIPVPFLILRIRDLHVRRSIPRLNPASALILALVLLVSLIFSCHRAEPASPLLEIKDSRLMMGTLVEITVAGRDRVRLNQAVSAAFAEIERLSALMNYYSADSDVGRINRSAGGPPVKVSPEVFEVIARANEISRQSDSAFDITTGALKEDWSFDPGRPRLPAALELKEKLPLIGWRMIVLDREKRAVGLTKPGMKIDLGGIAKGYVVDRVISALRQRGVTMALVSAGGDLYALGRHGDRPWEIGIQDPRRRGRVLGRFPAADLAVSTSGDYERFFFKDGRRYSHILDPKTGAPAGLCQSVTVIAREAWRTDGLATAVFVLGPEQGMALIEKTPGVEAVIIDGEGRRYESAGIKGKVQF